MSNQQFGKRSVARPPEQPSATSYSASSIPSIPWATIATVLMACAVLYAALKMFTTASEESPEQRQAAAAAAAEAEAAAQAASLEVDFVRNAKETAAGMLKNPDSVKFRALRLVRGSRGPVLCGYINGTNPLGGYAGESKLVAVGEWVYMIPKDDPDAYPAAKIAWHDFCE